MKAIFTAIFLLLSFSLHANEKTASRINYDKQLRIYYQLNEQYKCGFAGFRWDFKNNSWLEQQSNDFFDQEVQQLKKRIEECKANQHIPIIASKGKILQDFIPNGWVTLSAKIYNERFGFVKADVLDTPVSSPILKPLFIDFNQDKIPDIIALIGRTTRTSIGFDDFRLLILQGYNNGYKLRYNVKLGLDDLHLFHDISPNSRFSIISNKDNKSFSIENRIHYQSNDSSHELSMTFSYWNNQFVISQYSSHSMNFIYSSSPTQKELNLFYDFEKRLLKTYNSRVTSVPACDIGRAVTTEEAAQCPDTIQKTETLVIPNNKLIEITQLVDLSPIDWEKEYGIKAGRIIQNAFCKTYAEEAKKAQLFNKKNQCGFKGLRWSEDIKGQEKWCLTVRKEIARTETKIRTEKIKECQSR